jgi:hypothetical protein
MGDPNVENSNRFADRPICCGFSPAYAQDASPQIPSQTDFKVLTDARIGIVKAALQLTPEQEKLWPPVEEAIRARADTRYQRIVAVAKRQSQQGEVDPVALLRDRSDALAAKAAALKKLADARPRSIRASIPTRSSECASSGCVSFIS